MDSHEMWVCIQAAAILAMSCGAAVSRTRRTGIILYWLSCVVFGAILLAEGQEFLGLAFWMLSTLQSLVLLFFSLLFGEFESEERVSWISRRQMDEDSSGVPIILGLLLAIAMAAILCVPFLRSGADLFVVPSFSSDKLGVALLRDHWLALLFLGMLFSGIGIGAGVISRTENGPEDAEGGTR